MEYPLQGKRYRDIQVLHLNTQTGHKAHWKIEVQGIPEHCRHPLENTRMVYVKKVGKTWTFRYTSEKCEVTGSFQEGELKFRVQKVQNLRQPGVGPGGK